MVLVIEEDGNKRFEEVHYLDTCLCKVFFLISPLLDIVIALLLVLSKYLTHLFDNIVYNFFVEHLDFIADIVYHIYLKCLQGIQKSLILLKLS